MSPFYLDDDHFVTRNIEFARIPPPLETPNTPNELTLSIYVCVGTLAVFIWDILQHIQDDFQLLFRTRITLPTFVYFLSRLFSFTYLLGTVLFETIPIENCGKFAHVGIAIYVLGHSTTALLFYFRVCAVYSQSKYIVAFFGLSWLAVLGGGMTTIHAIVGIPLGTTQRCTTAPIQEYLSATIFTTFLNDTLIFAAITHKLVMTDMQVSAKEGMRNLCFGRSLSAFSRALLQESQICYLIAVCMNAAAAVAFYAFNGRETLPFRTLLIPPMVALENIMGCWVFRNAKLSRLGTNFYPGHLTTDIFMTNDASRSIGRRDDPSPERRSEEIRDYKQTGKVMEIRREVVMDIAAAGSPLSSREVLSSRGEGVA